MGKKSEFAVLFDVERPSEDEPPWAVVRIRTPHEIAEIGRVAASLFDNLDDVEYQEWARMMAKLASRFIETTTGITMLKTPKFVMSRDERERRGL